MPTSPQAAPRKSLLLLAAILLVAANGFPASAADPAPAPASNPAVAAHHYDIVIDTSQAPELKDWADHLRPILEKWYPIIVKSLPSKGFTAPQHFKVTFKKMDGVAYTVGTDIVCSEEYFKTHRDDQGAVVHEMVHVVQHYKHPNIPSWIVEGIADYIRWFKYEPESKRPHPNPGKAKYDDSYRTTAAFLNWATKTTNPDLIEKLNAACRDGKYSEALWKKLTTKPLADLGKEWKVSLQKKAN